MARLYADEDFNRRVVDPLRQIGHDVLTAYEAGQANRGISDADVLSFATGLGRAVLTFNRRDFLGLHRRVASHSGIIVCTRDDDPIALATRIDAALARQTQLDNTVIRVIRPS